MCGVERIPNQRRSDDFEVQTIIGHGGPDDARSSGGARPPCDRCSKAPRYAPGEFDDRGAGNGHAVVKVYKARVCYTLSARGIKPAIAAHVHKGRKGVAGPIVVPTDESSLHLPRPTSSGCEAIPRALSMKLRQNPSHYYVNVHNKPYPDGAIRGQLHR